MELTWSQHYCLACDRQTSGAAYCSQSCRLADHETSPTWSDSTSKSSRRPSVSQPSSTKGSGFYLSPAINFDAYKSPTKPTSSRSTSSSKLLSPSSSRSSLSSTGSSSSSQQQHHLSDKAQHELLAYTNSFDSTRNWKRRQTW